MNRNRNLALSLCLGLLLLAAPAAHAGALPSEDGLGPAELIGSWQGATSLGTTVLLTYHPDNTFTSTFHFPGVGAGNGHGSWIQTGLRTFQVYDQGMILDGDNQLALFLTIDGTATVSADGTKADFAVMARFWLPDWTLVDTISGEVYAKRIEVTPQPGPGI